MPADALEAVTDSSSIGRDHSGCWISRLIFQRGCTFVLWNINTLGLAADSLHSKLSEYNQ